MPNTYDNIQDSFISSTNQFNTNLGQITRQSTLVTDNDTNNNMSSGMQNSTVSSDLTSDGATSQNMYNNFKEAYREALSYYKLNTYGAADSTTNATIDKDLSDTLKKCFINLEKIFTDNSDTKNFYNLISTIFMCYLTLFPNKRITANKKYVSPFFINGKTIYLTISFDQSTNNSQMSVGYHFVMCDNASQQERSEARRLEYNINRQIHNFYQEIITQRGQSNMILNHVNISYNNFKAVVTISDFIDF